MNSQEIQIEYEEIQRHIFKDEADGWKGRNGCYCSKCFEFQNKGTYEDWLKIHKKIVQQWNEFRIN